MSKVQRVPRGLLALLDMVGQQPPGSLNDEYRATVDMLDLILAEIPTESTTGNDAAAVTGSAVTIAVPAGEQWFLQSIVSTIITVIPAVSNTQTCSLTFNGETFEVAHRGNVVGVNLPPVPVANRNDFAAAYFPRPIPLRAGDDVRCSLISTDAAGVQNMFLSARYKRIRV